MSSPALMMDAVSLSNTLDHVGGRATLHKHTKVNHDNSFGCENLKTLNAL